MTGIQSLSDLELVTTLPRLVRAEQEATALVIEHLIEVDRRRLYLVQACSSLYKYCQERLGYSEDEALKRTRVARLAARVPQALTELRDRRLHLTGLFVLAPFVTEENADELFGAARGQSRRCIERLVAKRFPRPDTTGPGRIVPLSESHFRVEFGANAELCAKIERAQDLLSHVIPSGNLAQLFERAIDGLIERETKQRIGSERRAGSGRRAATKRTSPGSAESARSSSDSAATANASESSSQTEAESQAPGLEQAAKPRASRSARRPRRPRREVARAVWQRDGWQCTYVDSEGRRCSERRFLTLEHGLPFACGGEHGMGNVSVLCAAHNAMTARQVFGESHIDQKGVESKVLTALCRLGFGRRESESALARAGEEIQGAGTPADVAGLLRAALQQLTG